MDTPRDQGNVSDCTGCQNLYNLTHQETREMCQIVQDVRTCLIWHTKGPGKCFRLYRMSDISGFILVNRNTLRPQFFVGWNRMSENSGIGLNKFHYINKKTFELWNWSHRKKTTTMLYISEELENKFPLQHAVLFIKLLTDER